MLRQCQWNLDVAELDFNTGSHGMIGRIFITMSSESWGNVPLFYACSVFFSSSPLIVSWEKGGRGTTVGESRSYLARKAALMPATEHSRFFLLAPWSLPTSTSAVPLSHFKISKLRLRKFCEDASRTRSVSPGGTAAGSSWTGSDRWLAGQVLLVVVIAVWW